MEQEKSKSNQHKTEEREVGKLEKWWSMSTITGNSIRLHLLNGVRQNHIFRIFGQRTSGLSRAI